MCSAFPGPSEPPFGSCKLWPFHSHRQEEPPVASDEARFSMANTSGTSTIQSSCGAEEHQVSQKPSLPQGSSKPMPKEEKKKKCWQTGMSNIERRWLIQTQRCCGRGEVFVALRSMPTETTLFLCSSSAGCISGKGLSTPSAE